MDAVVDRLHRSLVDAIQRRRPDIDSAPVTVAEIYQELIPYRVVRPQVGVELNADYEAALLRLLSGAGERVRLEPEEARETLRREAESSNPDTGLYRRFAACEVWVRPAAPGSSARPAAAGVQAEPSAERPPEAAPPVEPAAAEPAAPVESRVRPVAVDADVAGRSAPATSAAAPAGSAAPADCAFCHEALPVGREVRFCPHCGADQSKVPCAVCGETLERGWRFCIACGEPASA